FFLSCNRDGMDQHQPFVSDVVTSFIDPFQHCRERLRNVDGAVLEILQVSRLFVIKGRDTSSIEFGPLRNLSMQCPALRTHVSHPKGFPPFGLCLPSHLQRERSVPCCRV